MTLIDLIAAHPLLSLGWFWLFGAWAMSEYERMEDMR